MLPNITGCRNGTTEKAPTARSGANPPSRSVFAVSYPLESLTQGLVQNTDVTVISLKDMGASPSQPLTQFRPDREAILKLQKIDLIITNGTGAVYANWLDKVTLPESKICASAMKGISIRDFVQIEDIRLVHSHGPEGEHSHPTMVPYTWLDPAISIKQASYICGRLSEIYPDDKETFQSNLERIKEELEPLSQMLQSLRELEISIVSDYPDFKFMTRAAGIIDLHLDWEQQPTAEQAQKDLAAIIKSAEAKPTYFLARSDRMSTDVEQAANSAGLKPVTLKTFDYPSTGTDSLDYISELKAQIETLVQAIKN